MKDIDSIPTSCVDDPISLTVRKRGEPLPVTKADLESLFRIAGIFWSSKSPYASKTGKALAVNRYTDCFHSHP
jgi:hypothetical protein